MQTWVCVGVGARVCACVCVFTNEITSSNQRFAMFLGGVGLVTDTQAWEPGTLSPHLGLGYSQAASGSTELLLHLQTLVMQPGQTAACPSLRVRHLQDPEPSLNGRDASLGSCVATAGFHQVGLSCREFSFSDGKLKFYAISDCKLKHVRGSRKYMAAATTPTATTT